VKRLIAVLAVVAASVAALSTTAGAAGAACGASAPAGATLVASASVDSTSMSGTNVALPGSANYLVVACGVWNNNSHGYVDAAYNSGDAWNWSNPQQGWSGIGANWGELQINGATPSWGAYNAGHAYSTTLTGASGNLKLVIWDGYPTYQVDGWYGDNSGSLSVDVYQLAPPRPTSADQCKKDGWQAYGIFKNQGDCVSYVATNGKNPPAKA
jgi:hypothetical protein